MHGMGLAWTMLLASEAGGKSSCLEITGQWKLSNRLKKRQWKLSNRLDYYSLSRANGVH